LGCRRGLVLLTAVLLTCPLAGADAEFRRGDVNVDGVVDIGDVHFNPFLGVDGLACLDAADTNDDGLVNLTDALYILYYLFRGGAVPPAPGPDDPGPDVGGASLGCASYEPSPPAEAASFALGFEEPVVLEFLPGEPARGEALATLESAAANLYGTDGWSVSIGVEGEGLQIVDITTAGTASDAYPSGLVDAGFGYCEVVDPLKDTGSGPQGPGAVLAVITSFKGAVTVAPGETVRVARMTLESTSTTLESNPPRRIFCVDGRQGSGLPVKNRVRYGFYGLAPQTPVLGSADVILLDVGGAGRQRPGDCNQDSTVDISDAICLLGHLFLGQPTVLPCGDGSADDLANIELLDTNADGELDLSDAVRVILFLFTGGPPPEQGLECRRIDGCPDVCIP
jgi:hypothetical protein